MSNFVILGYEPNTQSVAQGEYGYVAPTGVVISTTPAIAISPGGVVQIDGAVTSRNFFAVSLNFSPSNGSRLSIGPEGVVSGPNYAAVGLSGAGSFLVQNAGTLMGEQGVRWVGVTNNPGYDGRIHNTGTIIGDTHGVNLYVGLGSAGLVNSGEIHGGTYSVLLSADQTTGTFNLVNSGRITGSEAIYMDIGSAILRNSGEIEGRVVFLNGAATIFNSGEIHGNIHLGTVLTGGVVQNSGVIDGDVEMNAGNLYIGRGGEVTGAVYGGNGDDTMSGGDRTDEFDGGAGADSLSGGGGADLLYGGDDGDSLKGEDGNDLVAGGLGNDTVIGGAGEDTVNGGSGDDRVYGGGGNDLLIGGGGRDILFGEAGADSFRYVAASDSTAAASDVLKDFGAGDVIDLDEVFAGDLLFMGTGAFATGGAASVRYQVAANGTAVVLVDADGDRAADMRILVFNTAALDAGDFVL